MIDLKGDTVVITGGNGGLGIATAVAHAGANVAIWVRNQAKTDAAIAELAELGTEVAGFACDQRRLVSAP